LITHKTVFSDSKPQAEGSKLVRHVRKKVYVWWSTHCI